MTRRYEVVLGPAANSYILNARKQRRDALANCLREELDERNPGPNSPVMVSLPLDNRVYFALPLSCGGIVAIYRSLNQDDLAKLRRQRGRPVAEYGYYVVDFLPPESGIYVRVPIRP